MKAIGEGAHGGYHNRAHVDFWLGSKVGHSYNECTAMLNQTPKEWIGYPNKSLFLIWLDEQIPTVSWTNSTLTWPRVEGTHVQAYCKGRQIGKRPYAPPRTPKATG